MTDPNAGRIGLEPAQFAAAFPFHLALDQQLRLIQTGDSLRRACPDLQVGDAFTERFRSLRPEGLCTFAHLLDHCREFVLIEHLATGLRLRGGFTLLPANGLLVFLGSPWITDMAAIAAAGLRFEDFALHDPIMDMLQVLQASRRSVEEGRELAQMLRATLTQLRARESEAEKLALIAARTDNAVILTDAQGLVEWVNDGFTRITGYALADVVGRSPGSVLQGPGTDPQAVRRMGEKLRQGQGFHEEILNYRRDGSPYWLALAVQAVANAEGRITHFMAIERDISAEVAARQRQSLQLDASRLLMGAHSLKSGIDGILQLFCERLDCALGLAWTRCDGTLQCLDHWHASDIAYIDMAQASVGVSLGPGQGLPGCAWTAMEPRWSIDMAGSDHPLRTRAALDAGMGAAFAFPVLVDGALWGVLEFFSRRQMRPDEALLNMCALAGNQIGQFIARCSAEADLRAAKDGAEAANLSKSQFVATLSHEIRTPLNAVIGMGSLLARLPLEPTLRPFVKTIQESSEQLLTIVNDVLDMSRLEAGHVRAHATGFRLDAVVEHVIQITRGLPGAAALCITAVIEPDIALDLRADAARLTQVLINLLANAVKFTDSGSVTLRVARKPDAHDPVRLVFTVTDTGRGVEPGQRERIFDPFEQGMAGNGAAHNGSGLGLAISRRIAGLLGGKLELERTGPTGSVFSFSLPLEIDHAPQSPSAPAQTSENQPKGLRILVAEDTPASQLVIRLILERLGHSVRVVEDGEQAVTACFEERFDLVFMDVQMPRMDGLSAAKMIVAQAGKDGAVPIIALSAYAQEADKQQALAHGMVGYLCKPIRFEDIQQVLQQLPIPRAPIAAQAPVPLVDSAMLAQLCEDLSPDGFAIAMHQFDQDTISTLQHIRAAARTGQEDEVRRAAHRLKGLFGQFGAAAMAQEFGRIELLPTGERSAAASDAGPAANAALDAVQKAAQPLLNRAP